MNREAAAYWIPAFAGMTVVCGEVVGPSQLKSPAKPFRLARQLDGPDLLELDRALAHQVVEIAVGCPRDFRAIEVDLERAAVILFGPGRGIADALHAGRDPILLLVEAL